MVRRNRNGKAAGERPADGDQVSAYGTKGGMYPPLSDGDVARVVEAAFEVLERTGMAGATDEIRDCAVRRGATIDPEGRLLFPRSLTLEMIASANRDFILYGQHPDKDVRLRRGNVHFATAGAAIKMLDRRSKSYRPSTVQDLYELARVGDQMPNIQWLGRLVVVTEAADSRELDLNTAFALAKGSTKHIAASIVKPEHVPEIVDILETMTGRPGSFKERPFFSVHSTIIVSPLSYAGDACDVAIAAARAGMPILTLSAPMAGATAPAALAGSVVQAVTEALAAYMAVALVVPGHSIIASGWPFVVDLRTGAMSGGSGEQSLLSAAVGQVMRHLDMPTGVSASMADSKLPDNQAGYEKALTVSMAAMSGADFIYESAGMLGSLLCCSLESMVIDNEMISSIRRVMRGIEVTDDTLSVDVIDEASRVTRHYLGADQTLKLMTSEYVYPDLADRLEPDTWKEAGSKDMWSRASERVTAILDGPEPTHVSAEALAEVTAKYPIIL